MSYAISPPIYDSVKLNNHDDSIKHIKRCPQHFRPQTLSTRTITGTNGIRPEAFSMQDVNQYYDFEKSRLMNITDYTGQLEELMNESRIASNEADKLYELTHNIAPSVNKRDEGKKSVMTPEGYNVVKEGAEMVETRNQFEKIRKLSEEYETYLKRGRISEELKKKMREDFYKKLEDSFPIIKNMSAKLIDPTTSKPVNNWTAALRTAMEGVISAKPVVVNPGNLSVATARQQVKNILRPEQTMGQRVAQEMRERELKVDLPKTPLKNFKLPSVEEKAIEIMNEIKISKTEMSKAREILRKVIRRKKQNKPISNLLSEMVRWVDNSPQDTRKPRF